MKVEINPKLDLVLERVIDVPLELVWKAWTTPEDLKKWFCPKPAQLLECKVDLRPGGIFSNILVTPDGQKIPNSACYLEIVEYKKIVFTDALSENFRPSAAPNHCLNSFYTASVTLEKLEQNVRYTVVVSHSDEEVRNQNESRFHGGWGGALDQLVENIHSGEIK